MHWYFLGPYRLLVVFPFYLSWYSVAQETILYLCLSALVYSSRAISWHAFWRQRAPLSHGFIWILECYYRKLCVFFGLTVPSTQLMALPVISCLTHRNIKSTATNNVRKKTHKLNICQETHRKKIMVKIDGKVTIMAFLRGINQANMWFGEKSIQVIQWSIFFIR